MCEIMQLMAHWMAARCASFPRYGVDPPGKANLAEANNYVSGTARHWVCWACWAAGRQAPRSGVA